MKPLPAEGSLLRVADFNSFRGTLLERLNQEPTQPLEPV